MLNFKEMQLLAEKEFSIEDSRQDLLDMVNWFRSQPWHDEAMQVCGVDGRTLPINILDEAMCFFVPEDLTPIDLPDQFKSESLGMIKWYRIFYSGRFVYPVFDVKKQIMGMCGWDKFETPKYLDSLNHGYKAKRASFYGMEKLEEYYKSGKPIFAVEGIVCCLYLRSLGYQAIALLGSSLTPYVIEILKRFGSRLIVIPDNDEAGDSLVALIKRKVKTAVVMQSTVAKDIDDTRKDYEKELIEELKSIDNPFLQKKILRVR